MKSNTLNGLEFEEQEVAQDDLPQGVVLASIK